MARSPRAPSAPEPSAPEPSDLTDALGRPLAETPIERTPGYNAADEQSVRDAKRKAGSQQRARLDALRKAMHDPAFRELVNDYLEACHVFGDCRGRTPEDTYFALGERNVGIRLQRDIERASLDLFLTMRKEAIAREREREE